MVAVIIIGYLFISDPVEGVGITTELVSPPIVSTGVALARHLDTDPIDAGTLQRLPVTFVFI